MSQIQQQLQAWYSARTQSEQKLLIFAVPLVILLILYFFLWEPLAQHAELQQQRMLTAEQDIQWLLQARTEINQLRGERQQALKDVLETSLQRHNLQPESNKYDETVDEWRIRFKAVDFRKLLLWLNELRQQSTVVVAVANINREPTGGVDARFVLTADH